MSKKSQKHQPTRAEVIRDGEYLGFTEHESGATSQYYRLNGIIFCETCNASGMRSGWWCFGKESKVREHYGLVFTDAAED